ncbi:class I SAM-dependent methyltransferase [Nodularia sphaerocarpa]|uniref:class I SAM-dependent methyltransferase n=2 Tax=Nodularia sphaerocarpa TaxID=137816 RepID=UPI001EFA404B|nr:class I SAM-dependent methyltransferase [Nodularia sphaerocarpa]ULP71049.1 hypothetical protein BDGGKGIB_00671 [Nodularia sphaerocarpa UHCC 0038]
MQTLNNLMQAIQESGNWSHTSIKYQNDVATVLQNLGDHGDCVIEVGCYKGGLTAQLSFLLQQTSKTLIVIDIDSEMIRTTKKLLQKQNLEKNVEFFTGTLQQFIDSQIGERKPSLLVIDGDHRYSGVIADIKAVESMKNKPASIIFHDYSLRYLENSGLTDVLVDRAIHDSWGDKIKVTFIGDKPEKGGFLNLKENPGPHGHYFNEGGSEGALIYWHDIQNYLDNGKK